MKWNDLTMSERASFIKLGVENGYTNLNSIKTLYNKFQDGGEINSKKEKGWLTDWISEREDVLNKNFGNNNGSALNTIVGNINSVKEYVPNSFEDRGGEELKNYVLDIEKSSRENGYSAITGLPVETSLGSSENMDIFSNKKREIIQNSRIANRSVADTKKDINNLYNSMFEKSVDLPFSKAKQLGFQGMFIPNEQFIIYTNDTPSVKIHELTHSMSGKDNYTLPIQKKIREKVKLRENVKSDYYLDNPDEIYSRMMQIRHDSGLKPKDIIDLQLLNKVKSKVKKNSVLKEGFFDRYTDESMIDLLNNIAYNNTNSDLYTHHNYYG